MKKKCFINASAVKLSTAFLFATLITGFVAPKNVEANAELDRQFGLVTIGFLRAWDNVDGLFGDYVGASYKQYFSKNSRFVIHDLSKADDLLAKSKLPYHKVIEDTDVLGQITRATKTESVIRTKVYKEGATYRFILDWLHSPRMDLMASQTVVIEERADGKGIGLQDIQTKLHEALDRMIHKVPFEGHITGRDGRVVTVNLGSKANLKKGDTLVIGTLDEVKKHPLLRTIVDWRITQTGRVEVDETDEGIAFCKVMEETPGRQIGRFQKVIQIMPKPVMPEIEDQPKKEKSPLLEQPSLGWVAMDLWSGTYSREFSSLNGTKGYSGSGWLLGGRATGQLWVNREIFVEAGLGYGFNSFNQHDIATGIDTTAKDLSSKVSQIKGSIGYTYFVTPDFFGPRGWAKIGYQSTSYGLTQSATELTGNSSVRGLFIGLGGDLPVRGIFGAQFMLDFGFMNSVDASSFTTSAVNSSTSMSFYLGGYYKLFPRLSLRAGLEMLAQGADFTDESSLTHRVVTFVPSLVYSF